MKNNETLIDMVRNLCEAIDSDVPKKNTLALTSKILERLVEENIEIKYEKLLTYFYTDKSDTIKLKLATSDVVASGVSAHPEKE
jgi:hypothetical protein